MPFSDSLLKPAEPALLLWTFGNQNFKMERNKTLHRLQNFLRHWSHTSIYCRIVIYTNLAQLTAQKTTPQTFQSFQSTTQNEV